MSWIDNVLESICPRSKTSKVSVLGSKMEKRKLGGNQMSAFQMSESKMARSKCRLMACLHYWSNWNLNGIELLQWSNVCKQTLWQNQLLVFKRALLKRFRERTRQSCEDEGIINRGRKILMCDFFQQLLQLLFQKEADRTTGPEAKLDNRRCRGQVCNWNQLIINVFLSR